MFKVKYVDSIIMLVIRLDLNLIVSLLQHKCEVSETASTTNTGVNWTWWPLAPALCRQQHTITDVSKPFTQFTSVGMVHFYKSPLYRICCVNPMMFVMVAIHCRNSSFVLIIYNWLRLVLQQCPDQVYSTGNLENQMQSANVWYVHVFIPAFRFFRMVLILYNRNNRLTVYFVNLTTYVLTFQPPSLPVPKDTLWIRKRGSIYSLPSCLWSRNKVMKSIHMWVVCPLRFAISLSVNPCYIQTCYELW